MMIQRHRQRNSKTSSRIPATKPPHNNRGGQRSTLRRPRSQFKHQRSSYHVGSSCPQCIWQLLLACLILGLYWHPEWVATFLQGPNVQLRPSSSLSLSSSSSSLPVSQSKPSKPRPEDPRPVTTEIFTAFTTREKKLLKTMRSTFQQQQNDGQLIPCRFDGDCVSMGPTNEFLSLLRGTLSGSSSIKLHNSLPFHRYICGKILWGNGGTLVLEGNEITKCLLDGIPYVYSSSPPPVSGKGMKPIELFWNYDSMMYYNDDYRSYGNNNGFETQEFPCPIDCRTAGDYALLSIISVKDTRWEILSTMEGEKYYGQAKVNHKSYRHDQFYAVTSFQSDIPLPYFSWAEYHIQHPAVSFDKAIKGASFLANNCDSDSKREQIVLALMETVLRVDSLSGCHHNAEPPKGSDLNNKTAIQEQYLFHLAFENQRSDDYITEKLWGTLAAGTLPVYFGAPNVKEHVPPHSIIFVDDFASSKDLADFLIRLTKDKAMYESYHAWRYRPIDRNFQQKYEFTNTHSTCRMCKWAYAKKHGLGWNHTKQEIQTPHIPHRTCRNKMGLIGHPFKEYWLADEAGIKAVPVVSATNSKTCMLDASSRNLQIDGGQLQRKVFDHDGVTDIIIDPSRSGNIPTYHLKLDTPIVSNDLQKIEQSNGKEWWLQDAFSRMTILTSSTVEMALINQGIVQFPVSSHLRVRVIVEDVDTFHKGAKKRANYFGDLMKQDFFTPVEAYKIVQH